MTNNGTADHIGIAQIVPYLNELSARGHKIRCLSVESKDNSSGPNSTSPAVRFELDPLFRVPGYLGKVQRMAIPAILRHRLSIATRKRRPDLLHCRSYIPLSAVLNVSRETKIPFIFDMRGFWIDQRIEAKIWRPSNLAHAAIVSRFRKLESAAISEATHIITLTADARKIIQMSPHYRGAEITVVPCSVETDQFRFLPEARTEIRHSLGISDTDLVLAYSGSSSPVYRTDVLLKLYAYIRESLPSAKLLCLGSLNSAEVLEGLRSLECSATPEDVICLRVPHDKVPHYLSAADYGASFIIDSFSSTGVSATKVGEYMACGLPVLSNQGVGDISSIVGHDRGHVLKDFSDTSIRLLAAQISGESPHRNREGIRKFAVTFFGLRSATNEYDRVYRTIG